MTLVTIELNHQARRVIIRRKYANGFTSVLDPTYGEIAQASRLVRDALDAERPVEVPAEPGASP